MSVRGGRRSTLARRVMLTLLMLVSLLFSASALAGESPRSGTAGPRMVSRIASLSTAGERATVAEVSGDAIADAVAPRRPRLRFDRDRPSTLALLAEVRGLRRGLGFDLGLPESGNLHLNLYSGRDGFGQGRRWSLADFGDSLRRKWSLGAALDLVRYSHQVDESLPDAQFVLSPQLRLDLDALTGLPGQCDLLVQRTVWRGAESRAADDARVFQLGVKWRF